MNSLKTLLNADEEVEFNEKIFTTEKGIAALGPNIFVSLYRIVDELDYYSFMFYFQDENSRIFILSMYRIHALHIVCEV